MRGLRLLSLFLLLALASKAQVRVEANLDSASLFVGGKRTIRLQVDHPPGILVLEPGVQLIDSAEAIEVLSSTSWDTTLASAKIISLEKNLVLTAWDSGHFVLPAIPVVYQVQGNSDTLYTRPLLLQASLTPVDTATLMPLKPIIQEPITTEDFIPYIIGLLAAIALLVLFFWYWKRQKPKQEAPPPPPPAVIPPHILALEKFSRLEGARLWQQGKVKEYHTELTFILREYLESRFGILALESATSEIDAQMKDRIPEPLRRDMTSLLHTSDMVKFAKAEPPANIHEQLLDHARNFVNSTID